MLRRDPRGEAIAACGGRGGRRVAGRRDNNGNASARQGAAGRRRRPQLRLEESREPRLPDLTIEIAARVHRPIQLGCSWKSVFFKLFNYSRIDKINLVRADNLRE